MSPLFCRHNRFAADCPICAKDGLPAAPNCVYLIRAEERFGNGDHQFTADEQVAASNALYNTIRGTQNFTGEPRRMRVGFELNF